QQQGVDEERQQQENDVDQGRHLQSSRVFAAADPSHAGMLPPIDGPPAPVEGFWVGFFLIKFVRIFTTVGAWASLP
ncbi:MAG: hypothetical protein AAGG02_20210, partial [Cyanobacteria bacterium P01_H01_bin.15]